MTESIAEFVDRIRRHYDDGCFACGRDNPLGLHLDDFSLEDGVVSARFEPRPEYRGAGNSLHGGVAATALDEMLVWSGILNEKLMSVTGRIEVRYRKPLKVTDSIVARARVDELRGKRMTASGELVVNDEVKVQASGLFLGHRGPRRTRHPLADWCSPEGTDGVLGRDHPWMKMSDIAQLT